MQDVTRALDEVRALYQKVVGTPPPALDRAHFADFPPGVDPMQHAMREVDALKEISRQIELAPPAVNWMPHADVFAGQEALIVRIDVPGIAREGLKVLVIGGECVVRGERKAPENARELRALALERPWGRFERRFALPAGSHPDKVTARCADGVLELHIVRENRDAPKETKIELS